MKPLLAVITGPTGSGKTDLAIDLAEWAGTEIVSADSRQMYRQLPIGTAAPTAAQQARVRHHLVGSLELTDYYSAARFADDARVLLDTLWRESPVAVVCGGSNLYIDALTGALDELPTVNADTRRRVLDCYEAGGLEAIMELLRSLDPDYLASAPDLRNHKRLIHATEVSIQAGVPYSSLLGRQRPPLPFNVVKIAVGLERDELFSRINARLDAMLEAGFEQEARAVYPLRELNALNTIGYKEMFAMFDGTMPRSIAIPRIAKNTRVYAKKQLTWLNRKADVNWLNPSENLLEQCKRLIAP